MNIQIEETNRVAKTASWAENVGLNNNPLGEG